MSDPALTAASGARECPVCGATVATRVYEQRFAIEDHATRIAGYEVVCCGSCGAVYASGIPAQAVLDAYYRESSRYEYLETSGEQPQWQVRWHADVADSVSRLVPDLSARIVDIGCANADLLGMLKERGYRNVLGVDPAPGSVIAAAALHGVRVVQGDVFSLPKDAADADFVILSAVLEHIRDLRRALFEVVASLRPTGLLFVEVPDLGRFPDCVVPPFQQFSLEHVNYFTMRSLANAMAAVGLACVSEWPALRLVGSVEEPSICAVFRPAPDAPRTLEPDGSGLRAVREYVAASAEQERRVEARIRALVDERVPLILWGVGTHALHLLATTPLADAEIVALVDANPRLHGLRVGRWTVGGPESVASRSEALLICSPLRQAEIAAMTREKYGMPNRIVSLYESGREVSEMPAEDGRAGHVRSSAGNGR